MACLFLSLESIDNRPAGFEQIPFSIAPCRKHQDNPTKWSLASKFTQVLCGGPEILNGQKRPPKSSEDVRLETVDSLSSTTSAASAFAPPGASGSMRAASAYRFRWSSVVLPPLELSRSGPTVGSGSASLSAGFLRLPCRYAVDVVSMIIIIETGARVNPAGERVGRLGVAGEAGGRLVWWEVE